MTTTATTNDFTYDAVIREAARQVMTNDGQTLPRMNAGQLSDLCLKLGFDANDLAVTTGGRKMTKDEMSAWIMERASLVWETTKPEQYAVFRRERRAGWPAQNQDVIRGLDARLARFADEFARNPLQALMGADNTYLAAAERDLRLRAAAQVEAGHDGDAIIQELVKDLLRTSRYGSNNSTAATHNLGEHAQHQALARVIEEMQSHMFGTEV